MTKLCWIKSILVSLALCVAAPVFAQRDTVQEQWLGQSAFKLTTLGGKVIVIDPWLTTHPKTPEACRKLEALGKVDVILVSQGHADPFGDTPALATLNEAPVWALACRALMP